MLPGSGVGSILRTFEKVAEEQYTEEAAAKERLLELQFKREPGEVTESEYAREEAAIIRELGEIENRKRAFAGPRSADQDRGFASTAADVTATASFAWHQDSGRKP